MRLDEILLVIITVLFIVIATYSVRKLGAKAHKMLTRMVSANIVLDIGAAAIWVAFPAAGWSVYRLGASIAAAEASMAVVLFALVLLGLIKRKSWAPNLAIVLTIAQRAFATYIFFPSPALGITMIWSLMIIYFAYKEIRTSS
jgi:hypothetical protein